MDPTIFGDDVVDGVDNVMASHINNLRAWASAFTPIIANMTEVSTTDTSHTLTDTDTAFQVFTAVGSTDFVVYLPVESTDNHPFWIANGTTDKVAFQITVKNSSSDTRGSVLDASYNHRMWLPTGTEWLFDY